MDPEKNGHHSLASGFIMDTGSKLPASPLSASFNADPAGIVTGTTCTILNAVHTAGVGMAVWRRSMPEALKSWADRVAADGAIKAGLLIPIERCEDRIEKAFRNAGLPPCPAEAQVKHDIADLIRTFTGIVGLGSVDVRLETVRGDACWKFHRDQVAFRLICTYSGPGTQYVPPDCSRQAIAQQRDYAGPLAMIETGAVAIFKGAQASGHDGIVHRSPPIRGSGQSRLMLCLSPPGPYSPDPEA